MRFAKEFLRYARFFLVLLLPVLAIYIFLRGIFAWHNRNLLGITDFFSLAKVFFSGLQQDITSTVLVNIPFCCLFFIGEHIKARKAYLEITRWLFIVTNGVAFALNIIDIGYFGFIKHRSDLEIFYILKDSLGSIKAIFSGFWFLFLVYLSTVLFLFKISSLILNTQFNRPSVLIRTTRQVLVLFIFLILARGLKEKPVSPYDPLVILPASQLPAAQNSVLTMAYSFLKSQRELRPYHFLSDEEANTILPTSYYIGNPNYPFTKKNVVLFILESFSRGYLLPGHPYKAKTPFLDSLIHQSIFFPNAFAVNYTSTKGIVPILGSVPTLLDEPLFLSPYANLKIQGIGNALKKKDYNTNFFMGAGDDHFSFGKFSHMVGIDHYYSKNNFRESDRYEDGNWGVFDAPFFNYGAEVLNQKKQPFLSVFFNLSSHYPFTIPKELRNKFNDPLQLPSQRAISYVDYALKGFFQKVQSAPWFKNTIFLFCADHWFPPEMAKSVYGYVNATGISFFIYDPSAKGGGINNRTVDQLDVVPTLLDLLNYNDIYHGFGRSAFDTTRPKYVINRYQEYYYQCISDNYVLGVDPNSFEAEYLFRFKGDSITSPNLVNDDSLATLKKQEQQYIRTYVQKHNQILINRRF